MTKQIAALLSLFIAVPGFTAEIKAGVEVPAALEHSAIPSGIPTGVSNLDATVPDLPALASPAAIEETAAAALAAPEAKDAAAGTPEAQASLDTMAKAAGAQGQEAEKGAPATDTGRIFFDNALPGEGLSLDWVQAANAEAANVPLAVARRRRTLQRNSYRDAMINQEILDMHERRPGYTHEVAGVPKDDQKQSGRCWGEASCSMVVTGKGFDVSRVHFYYYAMLEKSNRYLETVIAATANGQRPSPAKLGQMLDDRVQDGGDFGDFAFLVDKYGLVPDYAMKETAGSRNTMRDMRDYYLSDIKKVLASAAMALRADGGRTPGLSARIKGETVMKVVSILQTHLGVPPTEVEYPKGSGKFYTPQEFARKIVKFKSSDYVVVSSYPYQKRGKYYPQKGSAIGVSPKGRPTYDLGYLSTTPERMEELVIASIKGGKTVAFAADVMKNFDAKTGIMHPLIFNTAPVYANGVSPLTQAQQFAMGETSPDHMMLFKAADIPNPKKELYNKVGFANSWGKKWATNGDGHLYRPAFENVYEIVVRRRLLSADERKIVDAARK